MKRLSVFAVSLSLCALTFTGCTKRSDPKDVSVKFLSAIQRADYTEAKNYATEDSKAMLDALASFQKMLPESSQEKIKHEKFVVRHVETGDSFAVVTYASDIDTTGKVLKLKKEHGEWKVAFTKETILPELDKPLNEGDSTLMPADSSLSAPDTSSAR